MPSSSTTRTVAAWSFARSEAGEARDAFVVDHAHSSRVELCAQRGR